MTREEREVFVRHAMRHGGTVAEVITKIVDEWEDDVAKAHNDAVQEGREIGWFER